MDAKDLDMANQERETPEHLSISEQDIEVCRELARKIPSQSPKPERWLCQDHILWKIGDWEVRRPLKETLLDVISDHLKHTFGKDWADAQYKLPEAERHVVMRWWFAVCQAQKRAAPADHTSSQFFPVPRTGDVAEFGWLADDLYRLRLAGALDPAIVDRLRSMDQYQGARYEVAVAASFVRSGFAIEWVTGTGKHCEFVATHKQTGESIAVEAKSRHIGGTLNRPGEPPNLDEMRFKAHRYYNDALTQCPQDRPCAIFIDLNLPPQVDAGDHGIPWWEAMQPMLDAIPRPTAIEPALETCLVLTNFAAHYAGTDLAPPMRYVFWFPRFVRHRLQNMNTFIALIHAMERYGSIPIVE